MKKVLYYLSLLLFSLSLLQSCGKNETDSSKRQDKPVEMDEDSTSLSPAETFGAVLAQDIIGSENEVDLESFLSEEIYPIVSKSPKVTIDKISSSIYLLKYYDSNTEKNLIIQKFYNPIDDEIFFEYKETDLNTNKQFLK